MVDEESLRVNGSLDLLEAVKVGTVETSAPLSLGELGVSIVDEAAQGSTASNQSLLERLDETLHVRGSVRGVAGDVDRVSLPADEPEVLAVGVGGVGVGDVAGDAAPEVEEAGLFKIGAVEGQCGALEEDLGLIDGQGVVGGGGQGLGVERAAAEAAALGLVHARAGDGDLHVPEGELGLVDDGGARGDLLEGGDEGGDDLVEVGGVAVEIPGAGVRGSTQGPPEGELVGAVVAEGVVLDGDEGLGGSIDVDAADGDGEVDGRVEERLVGVGGDGEDDAIRSTGTLGGPEEIGALGGVDNGAVVQHILNGLEVVHGRAEVAGARAKTTPDAGPGETNVSTTHMGEVTAGGIPEISEDGPDVGATAIGDALGGLVVGDRVESSHADDQAAWVTKAIGLEGVVSSEGGGLGRGISGAVEREGNLVLVLGEGDGCGIDLDALLETSCLVGPAGVGAYDVTNTSRVEAFL